jgi:hypothetical protein
MTIMSHLEKSSEEEGPKSEPETNTVTTVTDTSTTETSSCSKLFKEVARRDRALVEIHAYRDKECFVSSVISTINMHNNGHDIWNKTACRRLRLQSIISHVSSSAHKESVRCTISITEYIAHLANPVIPKRGIKQAFVSLFPCRAKNPTYN